MRHALRAVLILGVIIASLPAVANAQPVGPGYRGPPPHRPYHHRHHRPFHRPGRPY